LRISSNAADDHDRPSNLDLNRRLWGSKAEAVEVAVDRHDDHRGARDRDRVQSSAS
jgi:hypothetical protein